MTSTLMRNRVHAKFCPDLGACEFVGGRGDRARCKNLDYLLDRVEEDRLHAESQRIRKEADELHAPVAHVVRHDHSQLPSEHMRDIADRLDPYHVVDGEMVRKADGRPVVV